MVKIESGAPARLAVKQGDRGALCCALPAEEIG